MPNAHTPSTEPVLKLITIEYLCKEEDVDASYERFLTRVQRVESLYPNSIVFIATQPYPMGASPDHDLYIQLGHERPGEQDLWELYTLYVIVNPYNEYIDEFVTGLFILDVPDSPVDDFPSTVMYQELTTFQLPIALPTMDNEAYAKPPPQYKHYPETYY